ncbi:MAG: hypothetical protein COV41_01705 [Candidatus Brennerbacteria bacterium CG11_big_fil_rev_8_21_14_0_20_43_10]|uniref:Uncharacterized protein n=1 Tax=Candidatus Brennerbacteria bacterium CG11_big_fil_rev_8_21_14_0_20_43_10 TaxID=1974523 RepID=A0A2H0PXL4_9BACT|nr:MAG: hypothetical protein COV41_01705 [Candidatus Brennerbacteria bacterium CG11_big_fil_rev_8_21_14_0_20_43_10]
MFTLFILIWGVVNLFLAVLSVFKIKRNKEKCDFIYWWGFIVGAFVWEDMLVFNLLHAGIAFVSLLLKNNLGWLVGFLVFWIVRSAGETLYFFLQQFIVPLHHPHNMGKYFGPIRKLFGNISDQKCYILLQAVMQSILVISTMCLIYILKNYSF